MDSSIQKICIGLRDFGCEFNSVVSAVQMAYKGIQSQPAMLSNHKDVVYVPLPYHGLDEVGVDESVFKEVHEVDCIVGGCFCAHSCAPNL